MTFTFNNEAFSSYQEMQPFAISYLIDNFVTWLNNRYRYIDFGYGDLIFASEVLECDSYRLVEFNQLGIYLDEAIPELFFVEENGETSKSKTKEYTEKLQNDILRKARLNEVHNQINTNFKISLNAMLMKSQYESYLDSDKTSVLIKSLEHIYSSFVKESLSRVETLTNETLQSENPDASYNYWLYIFSNPTIWNDAILNYITPLIKGQTFFEDFDANMHDIEAEIFENMEALLSSYFPIGNQLLKQIQTKDFNCLPFGGHVIEPNENNY